VGRDKGRFTEQQTEGTGTTTMQIRRKQDTNSHNRPSLPDRTGTSESPPPPLPRRSHGMEYRALFGPVGSAPTPGCAPSWSPVKINPVLAEPRTPRHATYLTLTFLLFLSPFIWSRCVQGTLLLADQGQQLLGRAGGLTGLCRLQGRKENGKSKDS